MVTEERLIADVSEGGRTASQAIVWITSYPKSGNTWLRVFLANLLADSAVGVAIHDLPVRLHAASRAVFDELAGIDSSDLTEAEAAALRPLIYRQLAATLEPPVFIKTHDRYGRTAAGEPLFPAEITAAVIYIVRNPLDVAVSYAHHDALPLDRIIDRMADDGFVMAGPGRIHLRQHVGSWSGHVRSWCAEAPLPVEVVRYEDLRQQAVERFARVAAAAGVPRPVEQVQRAMELSGFERLQRQEARHGFPEAPAGAGAFFRSGRSGEWREALTRSQVERIVRDHGAFMSRFGYLGADGRPV
jgi:aryl sulfotransferase